MCTPGTQNVALPTQYRFNVGPASQPIAGSMPSIVSDAGPTLQPNLVIVPIIKAIYSQNIFGFNITPEAIVLFIS